MGTNVISKDVVDVEIRIVKVKRVKTTQNYASFKSFIY